MARHLLPVVLSVMALGPRTAGAQESLERWSVPEGFSCVGLTVGSPITLEQAREVVRPEQEVLRSGGDDTVPFSLFGFRCPETEIDGERVGPTTLAATIVPLSDPAVDGKFVENEPTGWIAVPTVIGPEEDPVLELFARHGFVTVGGEIALDVSKKDEGYGARLSVDTEDGRIRATASLDDSSTSFGPTITGLAATGGSRIGAPPSDPCSATAFPTVGTGHGLHDREAEPRSRVRAVCLVRLVEAVEHPVLLVRRESGTGVLDFEHARSVVAVDPDRHVSAGPGGLHGVLDEVAGRPTNERGVERPLGGIFDLQVEGGLLLLRTFLLASRRRRHALSGRSRLQSGLEDTGFGPGQGEQVRGDPREVLRLLQHPLQDLAVLLPSALAAKGHVPLSANSGQRRAELVGRVSDEASLRIEGRVDAIQHGVEAVDELFVFAGVRVCRSPLVEIRGTDSFGLVDDVLGRLDGPSRQPPCPDERSPDDQDHDGGHEERG